MRFLIVTTFFTCSIIGLFSQNDINYQDLEYRMIGPFRGGRTVGAVGVATQENLFFVGVNNGGVWKTTDAGRTWVPIFDDAPTGSVGDLAVSQTNPDVIYVGSGEGLHRPDLSVGDGMFKTIDGGESWQFLGLGDVQQVARVIIHPENDSIVYVAGMGHPYGTNEMRGIFRSRNAGATWDKVLYIDQNTAGMQVEFNPKNPSILYASMWEHQEGPWENAKFSGPGSGLFKSEDGGDTWNKLENGLPGGKDNLGRIGIGISPSNPDLIYATVDANIEGGLYRSSDAGANWELISKDYRVYGRGGDFAELKVHPNDPNIIYSGNIASYRSIDGGYSWSSLKGAPGGDDYHRIWINPINPDIMLFAADQGATITVNGGKTWSSWYNQPTSQLYHVSTDNQFPYWVYGGQQESGAIAIASRGNGGQISFREFMGVGADEYSYVAPDPKNSDIIYGGRVIKFNKRTGQSQNIAPEILRSDDTRFLRSMPLMFHPADDSQLLFGSNRLWETHDGGNSWTTLSPDLTRKNPQVPESVGKYKAAKYDTMPQRATIYALGPSPLDRDIIWAGTDDGLVHVTIDGGKNWEDVTPDTLKSWDKISNIDASHFNRDVAYISVNAIRKDNMTPLVFKTIDRGKSWTLINQGMNPMGPVNVVREDTRVPGLLFAGTERQVYFSIDDGANWKSLRLNMPATSIRDLVLHDNDLVVGTHGRSIWILDDINPLRNLSFVLPQSSAQLLTPSKAIRVRNNMFFDTPMPPEEPNGRNPPSGAVLDYILPAGVSDINIQVVDASGRLIYDFNQNIALNKVDTSSLAHPIYWIQTPLHLSKGIGHHRVLWNLRHNDPVGAARTFSIAAVKNQTPSGPRGPFVPAGRYIVKLIVNNIEYTKEIQVEMDPRVQSSVEDQELQYRLSLKCYENYHELQGMRVKIDEILHNSFGSKLNLEKFKGEGMAKGGDIMYGSISESALDDETVVGLQSKLLYVLQVLQSSDSKPTEATRNAVSALSKRFEEMKVKFDDLNK